MIMVSETFKALGDPIRLEIIDRLSKGSMFTLSKVSQDLGLTRQGARKHLQVLADANLIKLQPSGRTTTIALEPASLKAASTFIADLESKWDTRLEALRNFVDK